MGSFFSRQPSAAALFGTRVPLTYAEILASAICTSIAWLTFRVLRNLKEPAKHPFGDGKVQIWIVLPALIGSTLSAAALWAQRSPEATEFGTILQQGLTLWPMPLAFLALSYILLSFWSLRPPVNNLSGVTGPSKKSGWVARSILTALSAVFAMAGTYLVTCSVYWAFCNYDSPEVTAVWWAFAFGPAFMLLAPTVGVCLMIGILGRDLENWRREWWTRLGSWLSIYSAASVLVGAAAIFGPWLLLTGFKSSQAITWKTAGPVLGWVGTVIGGLLAGNSAASDGESAKGLKATALSALSRLAAVLFIVGALVLVATLAHAVFVNMSGDMPVKGGSVYWENLHDLDLSVVGMWAGGLLVLGWFVSRRFDLNVFGLNEFYRNRLVRCYLGATRWQPGKRRPHRFTAFDGADDIPLANLRYNPPNNTPDRPSFRGPFPILNGALNLGGSSDLDVHTRHSASFVMTPLHCGADRPTVGYAPTDSGKEAFAGGLALGQAVSISGAAASPNMGYDTSALVSFLHDDVQREAGVVVPQSGPPHVD